MARERRGIDRRALLKRSIGLLGVSLLAACAPGAPTATQAPAPPQTPAGQAATAPAEKATSAPVAKPTTAPKPAASPASGGATPIPRVRAGQSTMVLTLDPTGSLNAPSYQAMVLTAGQLYRFDLDKKPLPDLVEKSDVSSDGKTITMTLKPNLAYSDGTPVTAEDAVFAYQRQINGPGAFFVRPIESAEATNDRTIVWRLRAPYPDFFSVLAMHFILLHPKAKVESDKDYFKHPVSAGPYVVKEWIPGTPTMVLEANPKYAGGPMMIERIELIAVADLTSRVLQLATGALDWAFDLPHASASSLPREVTATPHPLGGIYHVTFNLERAAAERTPLADPKVRQAISLAIDREAVNQKAFFGISPPATAFLYSGVPEHEPVLPNGGKRDVEGAKRLLASTPYAGGFEFPLQTWGARAGWKEAALIIAENLKEIGITAKVEPLEDAVVVANANSGNFHAMWTGTVQLPTFALSTMLVKGGFWANAARYDNPDVAALIDKAAVELDPARRKALLTDAQKLAYNDMPHIPIADRAVLTGTRLPNDVLAAVKRAEYIRVKTVAEMRG